MDNNVTKQFHNLATYTSLLVVLMGLIVIIGWAFNIELFKSLSPSFISMKFNTALCFVLTGLGVYLIQKNKKVAAAGLTTIVLFISSITLLQYITNSDYGIDQLLFKDVITVQTTYPGRMAPMTTVNFILFDIAVGLILLKNPSWAVNIAILPLASSFIAFLGYILNVEKLYGLLSLTPLALHTSIAFILLAIAIFAINTESSFVKIISSSGSGGKIARKAIPAIVVTIILLAWLRLQGQEFGLYDTRFGLALMIAGSISTLIVLLLKTAKEINLQEEEKYHLYQDLDKSRKELLELIAKQNEMEEKKSRQDNTPNETDIIEMKRLQEYVILLEKQLGAQNNHNK